MQKKDYVICPVCGLENAIGREHCFVCTDGRVVLIGFSIARPFVAGEESAVDPPLTLGYASLEQYATRAVFVPYGDVYALGATLYQLLTEEVPVSAADRIELSSPRQRNSK